MLAVLIGNAGLNPELWFNWPNDWPNPLIEPWLSWPRPNRKIKQKMFLGSNSKNGSNEPVAIPATPHRDSDALNMLEPHRPSPIAPNGGKPCEGKRAPGVRNTFVVFLRFFHFARRFWNQTCKSKEILILFHHNRQSFVTNWKLAVLTGCYCCRSCSTLWCANNPPLFAAPRVIEFWFGSGSDVNDNWVDSLYESWIIDSQRLIRSKMVLITLLIWHIKF